MKKILVDFDESQNAICFGGIPSFWPTPEQLIDIESVSEDSPVEQVKTGVDQLVQLKSCGYSASEIVELKQNGLI